MTAAISPMADHNSRLFAFICEHHKKRWEKPPIPWKLAASQFAIKFAERLSSFAANSNP
jgi:transposase-like protein